MPCHTVPVYCDKSFKREVLKKDECDADHESKRTADFLDKISSAKAHRCAKGEFEGANNGPVRAGWSDDVGVQGD